MKVDADERIPVDRPLVEANLCSECIEIDAEFSRGCDIGDRMGRCDPSPFEGWNLMHGSGPDSVAASTGKKNNHFGAAASAQDQFVHLSAVRRHGAVPINDTQGKGFVLAVLGDVLASVDSGRRWRFPVQRRRCRAISHLEHDPEKWDPVFRKIMLKQ